MSEFEKNQKLNFKMQFLRCRNTFHTIQVWHDGGHFRDRAYVSLRQAKTSKCGSAFESAFLKLRNVALKYTHLRKVTLHPQIQGLVSEVHF
jgi:hypothetical protein